MKNMNLNFKYKISKEWIKIKKNKKNLISKNSNSQLIGTYLF